MVLLFPNHRRFLVLHCGSGFRLHQNLARLSPRGSRDILCSQGGALRPPSGVPSGNSPRGGATLGFHPRGSPVEESKQGLRGKPAQTQAQGESQAHAVGVRADGTKGREAAEFGERVRADVVIKCSYAEVNASKGRVKNKQQAHRKHSRGRALSSCGVTEQVTLANLSTIITLNSSLL